MPALHGNWIDLVIIIVLLYFISEAWRVGFWAIFADFISFLVSLIVSLRAYTILSLLLQSNFSISRSLANALGFLLTAIIVEGVLSYISTVLLSHLPLKYWKTKWNQYLGVLPALGEGVILVAFILTLIVSLPLTPKVKKDISDSKIGGYLITQTSGIEKKLSEIFGGVIEDSLTYLTIKPGSEETSVKLNVESENLSVDADSENKMFDMVNYERTSRGVPALVWEPALVPVARSHAEDMWKRSYFGHVTPEGEDVGNRLEKAGINFSIAGENLALAPTLQTAHTGLMNSPGHKANILDTQFHKVGIGVIDNGVYGEMFVQVFTN
jgi:uncharacterized protein YkwD